jgi:hypothetical protein
VNNNQLLEETRMEKSLFNALFSILNAIFLYYVTEVSRLIDFQSPSSLTIVMWPIVDIKINLGLNVHAKQ